MPLGVGRLEAADLRAAAGEAVVSSTPLDAPAGARLVAPRQRRVQQRVEVPGKERLAEVDAEITSKSPLEIGISRQPLFR